MTWPWSPLEIVTATELNAATIPNAAVCIVSTSTGNTLTSGSTATISWESEVLDPLGWFTGGAPTVITPTIAGYYTVSVAGSVAADPDADYTLFQIFVQKNAATVFAYSARPSAVTTANAQFFGTTPPILMNGTSDAFRIQSAQVNTDADARTYTGQFSVDLAYPT